MADSSGGVQREDKQMEKENGIKKVENLEMSTVGRGIGQEN